LITRRSLLSQFGLLAVVGGGAWWLRENVLWPAPSPVFGADGTSGWLGFTDPAQRMPIVTASIGGTPVGVLLDSGAQSSVIDRGLVQRLGLKTSLFSPMVVGFGVSGSAQFGRAADLDVALGRLTLKGLRAAVFDVERISRATRRPFGLILGQDVLKVLVADIDFPAARLAFHAPESHVLPAASRPVAVRSKGRELIVPLTVEDRPIEAVLDTGASSALALSMETAQAAGLLSGRPVGWAPSVTFGGLGQDRVVTVETLAFAGETYRDVRVHIYDPDRRAPLPSGLLGVEAFDRFRVIIDVGRTGLHLAPGGPQVPRRRRRRRVELRVVPA